MTDVKREWFETDYYKVLGVDSKATAKEITSAYRKLAREYHPDKNQGDDAAEERFKEISAAYDVVGDESRRTEYDQVRRMGPMAGAFGGGGPRRQQPGAGHGNATEWDFEGMGGIGDLLGSVLGGQFGGGAPRPRQGADYEARMTVSFDESMNGLSANLTVGSERRQVSVKIPAGIKDGQRVRVRGRGGPGTAGGPAGDLLVTISVGPHRLFGRKGKHLTIDAPVTFAEAALGTDLKVPTFDESSVTLRIPAGTQSGKTFRAKGHGVKTDNSVGDLLVTVVVTVPKDLSSEQREALEAFAALQTESPRSEWDQ